MIQQDIRKLVEYGLKTGLVEKEDEIYTVNRIKALIFPWKRKNWRKCWGV